MSVLTAHAALLGLVYPGSLSLSPDGRRLAYVVPGTRPAVLVLDPERAAEGGCVWATEREPVLVRWSADGSRLWVAGLGEHGEPSTIEVLDASGRSRARGELDGAIEELVPADHGAMLLRFADVGSDRDGMNLGLRVRGPAPSEDPAVRRGSALPLRRLALATEDAGGIALDPVDLGSWTAWECDLRGGRLAVVASTDPSPGGYYRPSLLVVDHRPAAAPVLRTLLEPGGQLGRPRWSPTGDRLLVVEGQSIVSGRVHLFDLGSGGHRVLDGLDDVTDLGWLDPGTIWFAGWSDLGVQVGRTSVDEPGPALLRWTASATIHGQGAQPSLAVAPDRATAYAVWDDAERPPEIAALSLARPGASALTSHNAAVTTGLQGTPGVTQEPVAWRSPDGTEVHGLLLLPAARTAADGPLPLVLLLHGGPTWLWSASFAPAESNHLARPLAAGGAAVLLPNPRGSSGRGQGYARQVAGDMGGGDLADVLAGVDHLVARGVADRDRLAVMGLSYGGYLAALTAVTDPRFRAAVVMSGVSDWLGFAGTSAIGGGYDAHFHPAGDPATAAGREALAARSPLYLAHPGAVPTLFVHGALDRITPVAQAEALFRRLERLAVPTELVVYPGEGHELVEATHRRDAAARVIHWLTVHGVLDEEVG